MLPWASAADDASRVLVWPAGYPLDVPQAGAGLATYCVMAYHWPLLIAFSLRTRIQFVWGGCMLLPLPLLRSDRLGILQASCPVTSSLSGASA